MYMYNSHFRVPIDNFTRFKRKSFCNQEKKSPQETWYPKQEFRHKRWMRHGHFQIQQMEKPFYKIVVGWILLLMLIFICMILKLKLNGSFTDIPLDWNQPPQTTLSNIPNNSDHHLQDFEYPDYDRNVYYYDAIEWMVGIWNSYKTCVAGANIFINVGDATGSRIGPRKTYMETCDIVWDLMNDDAYFAKYFLQILQNFTWEAHISVKIGNSPIMSLIWCHFERFSLDESYTNYGKKANNLSYFWLPIKAAAHT